MAMQLARQYMAIERYLLLVNNSDRRYESYDGEVRLMAGGTSNHATIALNCGVALDQALGDDAVCRPYVTDKLVGVAFSASRSFPALQLAGSIINMERGNAYC
jgi:hypothetical protein